MFSSQQEDALLSFLLEIENQQSMSSKYMNESPQFFDSHIGVVHIKSEPGISIYDLFENRALLESYIVPVSSFTKECLIYSQF